MRKNSNVLFRGLLRIVLHLSLAKTKGDHLSFIEKYLRKEEKGVA